MAVVFVGAVDHLLSHFYEIFLAEAAELSEEDVLFAVFGVGRGRDRAESFCSGFLGGVLCSFLCVVVDILDVPGFQLISLLELKSEDSCNFLLGEAALPSGIEQLPNFPHNIIAKSKHKFLINSAKGFLVPFFLALLQTHLKQLLKIIAVVNFDDKFGGRNKYF